MYFSSQENFINVALVDKADRLAAARQAEEAAYIQQRNKAMMRERSEALARLTTIFGFDVQLFPTVKNDPAHVAVAVATDNTVVAFRAKLRNIDGEAVTNHITFEVIRGTGMTKHQKMILIPEPQGWRVAVHDDSQSSKMSACTSEFITDAELPGKFMGWAKATMPYPLLRRFVREVANVKQTAAMAEQEQRDRTHVRAHVARLCNNPS